MVRSGLLTQRSRCVDISQILRTVVHHLSRALLCSEADRPDRLCGTWMIDSLRLDHVPSRFHRLEWRPRCREHDHGLRHVDVHDHIRLRGCHHSLDLSEWPSRFD